MIYDAMTLDELQEAFVRLGSQLVAIQNSRQELLKVMAERKAAIAAKAGVASMSALEKDAFRDVLG